MFNDYFDLFDLIYLDVEYLFVDMEVIYSLDYFFGMVVWFLLYGMCFFINDYIKFLEGSFCSEENSCVLYDLIG